VSGNIRDYASIIQLVVLSNLEVINANMIENGINQKERINKLNNIAIKELNILINDNQINNIKWHLYKSHFL